MSLHKVEQVAMVTQLENHDALPLLRLMAFSPHCEVIIFVSRNISRDLYCRSLISVIKELYYVWVIVELLVDANLPHHRVWLTEMGTLVKDLESEVVLISCG